MLPRLLGLTALATVTVLVAASAAPAHPARHQANGVTATAETPPLYDEDDADADDPAIWVNPEDEDASVVIGTAKEAGMYVYDLDGNQIQHIAPAEPPSEGDAPGRYNNVDLVYGFELDDEDVDLAVASDRGLDRLGIWTIDPDTGTLEDVADLGREPIFSAGQDEINEERTAYGLTTWSDDDGAYALVSRADETTVALLELTETGEGAVGYETVREIDLPSEFTLPDGTSWTPCADPGELPHVEGMVVDETRDAAYLGQEAVGIWRVSADLTGTPRLIDTAVEYGQPGAYDAELDDCVVGDDPGFGGRHLRADIEGLTIYREDDEDEGYLLASSQGDDSFAMYAIQGRNRYLGSFSVDGGDAADGTQHSDGAAAVSADLGRFEVGLLVVQDGDNTPEGSGESSTNFKFVSWSDVVAGSGIRCLRDH